MPPPKEICLCLAWVADTVLFPSRRGSRGSYVMLEPGSSPWASSQGCPVAVQCILLTQPLLSRLYIAVAPFEGMSLCTAPTSCCSSCPDLLNRRDTRHWAPWALDALCLLVPFSSQEPAFPGSWDYTYSFEPSLKYCMSWFCSTDPFSSSQHASPFDVQGGVLTSRPDSTHPPSDCVPNNYIGGSGVVTSSDGQRVITMPVFLATAGRAHENSSYLALWGIVTAFGISLLEFLQVQANCMILHLRLTLMLVLVRAIAGPVLRPSRALRSKLRPLGAAVSTRGLLAFACLSGSCGDAGVPVLGGNTSRQRPRHRSHMHRSHRPKPRCTGLRWLWTVCLTCLGFHHLPYKVWAAPAGMPQALQDAASLIERMPDQMPLAADNPPQFSGRDLVFETILRAEAASSHVSETLLPRHCVLFRAGHPAAHFLAQLRRPYTQAALFQEALVYYPELQDDWTLHETVPQVLNGVATIVALPSWVLDSDQTVVVLDFSPFHGPVFAWFDWKYINRTTLAAIARVHAGELWDVYYRDRDVPLGPQEAVFARPGDVLRFQPPNSVCSPRPFLGNMLGLFDQWPTEPQAIPRESMSHKWYVMMSHVTRLVEHIGSDRNDIQTAAAEAMHCNPEDLRFAYPKASSSLHNVVYHGFQITGVLAATPRSEHGRNVGVFMFVDPRPLGIRPTFQVVLAGSMPISRILDFLGFVPPSGFCCKATGVPSTDEFITVSEDCTVELQLTPACCMAQPRSLSAPPASGDRSLATYGLDVTAPTTGNNPAQGQPTVFHREAPGTPDPTDTLTIEDPGEPDDEAGVAEVLVTAGFVVFAPRFQPERIQIDLWTPSTLDVVLPELADIRDGDTAVAFGQLLPVLPQPDRAFGSLLAVPEWDHVHAHVLIDTRGVDGRMFAYAIKGRLNKTSLLLHIGLASRSDLDVFLHGRALDQVSWYTFLSGDLIQISPLGAQPPDPVALEDMLRNRGGWGTACPHFDGPHPLAFFVLSDGGHSTIAVDPDNVRSSADFREEAARVFQYRNKVAVYPAIPRIDDLSILGQKCKTALVATEKVLRFPIPPGRLPSRHVLLLDARLLLRDISWLTADNGLIAVQAIAEHFQEYTPQDYCVSVTGAPTESREGRTFLRAPPGTLLRLTYVHDAAEATSSSEVEGSTTSSAGAFLLGSTPASDESRHIGSVDRGLAATSPVSFARSRSPRRQNHTPGIWVAGLALAQVILASQVQPTEGYRAYPLHFEAVGELEEEAVLLGAQHMCFLLCIVGAGTYLISRWLEALFSPRPCSHKLLQEPQGSNDADRANLDTLRSFVGTLGGPWLPRLPFDLQHLLTPDVDTAAEPNRRIMEELCSVPCLILAFDFTPDAFLIELVLPATPEELVEALQVGRPTTHRAYLPSLLPVLPQPLAGTAVFVAAPNWHPMGHGACFDLTRVDNRLYVTFVPEYVDAAELLQIADLPTAPDFSVWVGPDLHHLIPGERIHTFPGMLVQFVPEDTEPDLAYSLGQLLLLSHFWNTTVTVPTPDFGPAYCLAHQGQGQLFIPDPRYPTRYRQHIAEATGASLPHTRLYASRPRPQNAAINGVPCRTVLAVGDRQDTSDTVWHMSLFDCRFLEMGWCAAYAVNGSLDIGGVLDDFNNVAPLGWHTVVLGEHPQTGVIRARAGQVFVLAFHANADHAEAPTEADPATLQESGTPTQGHTEDPTGETESPEATAAPASPALEAAEDLPSLHFLLLAQGYTNEHLSLQLAQPITVEDVLSVVDASRDAAGRHRFPRLVPATLQPALPFACLITMPEWEAVGLPIIIACHVSSFRVFSVVVPPLLQAGDILNLANEHDRNLQVFHGDIPWAIPHAQQVQVNAGDLFTLLPANQPFIPPIPFATALTVPVGGPDDPVLPGPFQAGVWLLAEFANQRFVHTTHPVEALRTAVARRLDIDVAAMTFVPTTPAVRDHARHGLPSDHVYFALPAGLLPGVVYAIDLRPLLLELVWAFAPGGRIDIAALCAQVAHWCPRTHHVSVLGGYAPHQTANHYRFVHPGQVITLRFDRRWGSAPAPDPDSDSESDGDQDHDTQDSADDNEAPEEASHSAASASTQPDAGTGSTRRHTFPAHATERGMPGAQTTRELRWNMWRAGLPLGAFAEGNLYSTPAPTLFVECEHHWYLVVYATAIGLFRQAVAIVLALAVGGLVLCGRAFLHTKPRGVCTACMLLFFLGLQVVAGVPEELCEPLSATGPEVDRTCTSHELRLAVQSIPRPLRAAMPFRSLEQVPDYCPQDTPANKEARPNVTAIPGPTLLEEAVAQPGSQAYFLASTLLDVLSEHFAESGKDSATRIGPSQATPVSLVETRAPVTLPQVVSLASAIPPSPFQKGIEAIRNLVPPPRSSTEAAQHDWLDSDLTPLFRTGKVRPDWKLQLASMPKWHDLGAAAHTAVEIGTPFHLGEHRDTPLEAELLAIAWALSWVLDAAARYSDVIELRYDCTSAGGGVFATSRTTAMASPDAGPTLAEFASQLRQTVEGRFFVSHSHVKGHSGELGNELCDLLSGQARRQHESFYDRCLPTWPMLWRQHPNWAWGWMAHANRPDLPDLMAFAAEANRLQQLNLPALPPSLGMRQVEHTGSEVTFDFTVASYNINSMFDPTAPKGRQKREPSVGLLVSGKRDLLKGQLLNKTVWLTAFQETRLPGSETLPDKSFLMLSAAATAHGHGGCSLWINLTCPDAHVDGKAVRLARHEASVVVSSPRRLHVLIETPYLSLLVCVLHAPRAKGQDASAPQAFWREQTQFVKSRPPKADFLILADANSHVGEVQTASIFGAGAEPENLEGSLFHDFLLETAAFLPATDPDIHVGQHWTWQTPDGSATRHRIDFAGIPTAWRHFDMCSWVWSTIEALQTRLDHLPACLALRFSWIFGTSRHVDCHRTVCRPPNQPTPEQRARFGQALALQPPIGWDVPVDHHCLLWARQMQSAAAQIQQVSASKPTQAYLQEATLDLVHRRAGLRTYMRNEETELRRRRLLVAFAAFRLHAQHRSFTTTGLNTAAGWLHDVDVSLAQAWKLFDECTVAIRAAVRRDRISYLEGLQAQVTLQDLRNPKALYASVRRAFPSAKASRRRHFQPLPAVQLEDGTLASTRRERNDRWIRHFSAQEGGQVVTMAQYDETVQCPDITVLPRGPVFCMRDIPTLAELEQVILSLRPDKAAGPDGLTAEAFRADAARSARVLFPLSLKNCFRIKGTVRLAWRHANDIGQESQCCLGLLRLSLHPS